MPYRKNKKSNSAWVTWQKANRQTLIDLGVPEIIVESESRWWYFLEHGDDPETEWNVNLLSTVNAKSLMEFLVNKYSNGEANDCIKEIESFITRM